MAINLFNYTNQKLNAEQFRIINGFNSFNFAGIIGETSPFSESSNLITLNASESNPVTFLGGGLILTVDSNLSIDMATAKRLAYLRVSLSEDGTILSDEYSGVSLQYMSLSYYNFSNPYTIYSVVEEASGSPAANNYYEYNNATGAYTLSVAESVDESVTYYIKYESSTFTFSSSEYVGTVFHYNGNTLWLDNNTFIIPLVMRGDSQDIYEVIQVKSLKDLSSLLSLENYNALKAYCEGTFVWTVGGQEEVVAPDGTKHKKGDIAGLNITGTTIMNRTNNGTSDQPLYNLPVSIPNIRITELAGIVDSEELPTQKLFLDSFGQLKVKPNYKVPLKDGGVYNPSSWDENNPYLSAKQNLHIRYGVGDPSSSYNAPIEGDIYLKIIE